MGLVLVSGIAQAGLGLGQALSTARTSPRVVAVEVACWNAGNAAVLAGTLARITALVDLGGVLLVVTLGLLARGVRPTRVPPVYGARRWCSAATGCWFSSSSSASPSGWYPPGHEPESHQPQDPGLTSPLLGRHL